MNVIDKAKSIILPQKESVESGDFTLQAAGVPAGAALDAASNGYGNVYSFSLGGGISSYAPLYRCITLISSTVATMITRMGLVVVDDNEEAVDNQATRRVLELLKNSPDGDIPAFTFFEDLVRDYLVQGNALVQVSRAATGRTRPVALHRLRESDAQVELLRNGKVYRAAYAYNITGSYYTFAAQDVCHVRWPLMRSATGFGNTLRQGFADAPVKVLRPSTAIGEAADQYVLNNFVYPAGRMGIQFPQESRISPEAARKVAAGVDMQRRQGLPSVVPDGGQIVEEQQSETHSKIDLRKYQASIVASVYGVPTVFLVSDETTWGTGVENYIKIFNFQVNHHLSRILDAISLRVLPTGMHLRTDSLAAYSHPLTDIARLFNRDRSREGAENLVSDAEYRRMIGLRTKDTNEARVATN